MVAIPNSVKQMYQHEFSFKFRVSNVTIEGVAIPDHCRAPEDGTVVYKCDKPDDFIIDDRIEAQTQRHLQTTLPPNFRITAIYVHDPALLC